MYAIFQKVFLMTIAVSPLLSAIPAHALPGQTIREVAYWTDHHRIFSQSPFVALSDDPTAHWGYAFRYETEEMPYGGGLIQLSVNTASFETPRGYVTSESVNLRGTATIVFDRNDETGNRVIEQVWGNDVLTDFVNSRYTNHVEGECYQQDTSYKWDFYLGEQYGYIAQPEMFSTVRAEYGFQVLDIAHWHEMLIFYRDQAGYCFA